MRTKPDIEDLCSSDTYKRVDYENAREPTWCTALTERVVAPFRVDSPFKQVIISASLLHRYFS